MSVRAVQKKKGTSVPQPLPDSSSSEEEFVPRPKNPFALLQNDTAEEQSSSSEEAAPPQPVKKATKTKQNKKKKGKPQVAQPAPTPINDQEFDQILKEYGASSLRSSQQETVSQAAFHLFDINPKFLLASEELKRMFGAGVVNPTKDTPNTQQRKAQLREQRRLHGSQKVKPVRPRQVNLVKTKNSWPALNNFLQMELVDSVEGINYFRVVWTDDYKGTQKQFYSCVQTGDPNTLAMLLQQAPYQIDTMLQLVEACKHTGELDMAVDLLERILYRFETMWHPMFNPFKSNTGRLEYKHETNRSFFMAFFRHIQMLKRRGCLRSALEICKFVLSIDHSDPLGILFFMDEFCLQTSEYDYLLELYYNNSLFRLSEGVDQPEELELLPNFLFSCALAKFHIEKTKGQSEDYVLPSGKVVKSADSLLQHAIMMFPSLITPLLSKIGVSNVRGPSGDNLMFHELFSNTRDYEKSSLITQLTTLYLTRISGLWKDTNQYISQWLQKNIKAVVQRYDSGDAMFANCKALVLEHYLDSRHSTSTERHILLSEEEETLQTLPPEVAREGVRIYDDEGQPAQQAETGSQQNPLMLFLQSFMPWFDPNARPEEQHQLFQQLAQHFQYESDSD